ncbi:glutamate-5-semialdehyde dehydrogenase [Pontibacillus litoralis]|uniref:Gamma-glutamyl phosphate reductase n=1 Tax=Pontibacillus litoralis JSM 072002 TaxID=1385512 RepID=A0A0A5G4U7_9BACI|nr:glutamate-5-semialdehyde dehydrogenase [Pontibacillus litoralis]KGX87054.1 gamma-glutamyl phosphate reductase [Pontibacillus litoralis JSM 072002]
MSKVERILSVKDQACKAHKASKKLAVLETAEKDRALQVVADRLEAEYKTILQANELDLEAGRRNHFDDAYMDRLALTKERIAEFAQGLRNVIALQDPSGVVKSEWTLENGLHVQQVSVPLGVIGMIYEARPNVTVDATGLALKSGNTIILKGGSSAIYSNQAIVEIMRCALEETKIPKEAVQFIASTDRETTKQLFTMKEYIDVLIPRGGGQLIQTVVENATVPVLETGVGNCHIYVDKEADVEKAIQIIVNAKTDRPAVCNAAETLLVHKAWLDLHHDRLINAFQQHGIHAFADEYALPFIPRADKATEDDWANEFLSRDIAVKTVDSVLEAVEHIERYGTKHSEAIVTENEQHAEIFMKLVDAAALYHNASTRFTDGGALGFGAEIGISTQKLHARGPMGLHALTTVKYIMRGSGHIR